MTAWSHLGCHDRTVRRSHDWQRLLEANYPAWSALLQRIERPAGLRFFANFGAGELEFELSHDADGYVAIPIDGATPQRLNATEAEFTQLDVRLVLDQIKIAAGCDGTVEQIDGVHHLGARIIEGKTLDVVVAIHGLQTLTHHQRRRLGTFAKQDLRLLLVPELSRILPTEVEDLARLRVAVSELPAAPPWALDWSPLVLDDRFQVPLHDAAFFFGSRYAIIVDHRQQRIWVEGRELKVRADGQCYRLLAHLASRPRAAVPVKELVNRILEATVGNRDESKILSDVKSDLKKAVQSCLTPKPSVGRIDPDRLVTTEDGRTVLDMDPLLVKVIRQVSEL